MITLALDASTYVGDVAVLSGEQVIADETVAMKGAEREHLMPAVVAVLTRAGIPIAGLDRVVCGAGPGSFTSLRIAGAIAKGIASGARKPLFTVPSMALMIGGASLPDGMYLVSLDALRGEFYVGLYAVEARGSSVVERRRARLVSGDAVEGIAAEYDARVVSPALHPGAIHAPARVRGLIPFERGSGGLIQVDIDSWEPAYGRLAEAQVRWEQAHGRPLAAG